MLLIAKRIQLLSAHSGASAGYVAFWKEPIFASDCTTVRGADDEHTEYLYHLLKNRQSEIQAASSGAAQPHVYPKDLEVLKIPQPDQVTLKKIVSECRSIDDDVQFLLAIKSKSLSCSCNPRRGSTALISFQPCVQN